MIPVQSLGLRLLGGARASSPAYFVRAASAITATCAGSLMIVHLPW